MARNAKVLSPGGLVFKRTVDITLGGLLLAISVPLILVAAILIKLDSEGPIIFRQVRMGRRFRRFHLLKLRTMTAGAAGPAYTLGADPRITRVGHYLRRFKVDELPQLWHVLCGDMSLVGPRPVIPQLAGEFRNDYMRLLAVRPGLTDPAALKYFHEEAMLGRVPDPLWYFKTVVTPDKLRISEHYMRQATTWSDLGVMVHTLAVLLVSAQPPKTGRALQLSPALRDIPELARPRTPQPGVVAPVMSATD
jgi:lipopolysaccharide/colanic/teichoic acid biosynthesis glycosyltransferase